MEFGDFFTVLADETEIAVDDLFLGENGVGGWGGEVVVLSAVAAALFTFTVGSTAGAVGLGDLKGILVSLSCYFGNMIGKYDRKEEMHTIGLLLPS